MPYICPRCGYSSSQKGDIRKHFKRKKLCKFIHKDVSIAYCFKEVLGENPPDKKKSDFNAVKSGENAVNFCENAVKNGENAVNFCENAVKSGENAVNFCENAVNFCENTLNLVEDADSYHNIEIIDGKYRCSYCKKLFKEKRYLDDHLKKSCKMLVTYNNIYKYDTSTFGKNIFGYMGGEIYIVQTEYSNDKEYRIGVTNNLYNKMKDYRCISILEPQLHYYYPCPDIKKTEIILKNNLKDLCINRDVYKGDIETIRNMVKKTQVDLSIDVKEFKPILKECDIISCKFCNEVFYSNEDLFRHYEECADVYTYIENSRNNEYICLKCNKNFLNYTNLKRHMVRCKEKSYTRQDIVEAKAEVAADKNNVINELKNQIEVLLTKVGNTTNNNTINININAYGNENTEYITSSIMNKLIEYGPYKSIPRLIKHIHFNPDHKENQNIKIPNRKEKYAKIYNGDKWELRDKKETIEDLSDRAYNLLEDHYDGGNKHMDKFISNYEDENTTKKIHTETEIMILNNQDVSE